MTLEQQRLVSDFTAQGDLSPNVFDSPLMLDAIEANLRSQGVDECSLATLRILATARRLEAGALVPTTV